MKLSKFLEENNALDEFLDRVNKPKSNGVHYIEHSKEFPKGTIMRAFLWAGSIPWGQLHEAWGGVPHEPSDIDLETVGGKIQVMPSARGLKDTFDTSHRGIRRY